MKNTFGNSITLTLFGESHGNGIGAIIDGLAPGIEIDEEYIKSRLALRRPSGAISTSRVEADELRFVSGVYNGYTTGTPICILIENKSTKSCDYDKMKNVPRPGHADYTAECKYHGFQDARGGGHFSGRLTAPIVAVGAVMLSALKKKGISIGTHIKSLAGVNDREFSEYTQDINALENAVFPVLGDVETEMKNEILRARELGDSVGGVLETAVIGVPAGLGEPWFDSVESLLSHALFSIPAIKGVEFGDGFGLAGMLGSEANDAFFASDGKIKTLTNHNGGINGGITNGMPIIFRCAVKPTPSIYKEQASVELKTLENTTLRIEGRHDPAIIHRARVVVDSITALVLCDMLASRYGTDYLRNV